MDKIENLKKKNDVALLVHHYCNDEIVKYADFVGDSFDLSQKAAAASQKNIVFCGVHFMGESAKVLAKPEQKVFMPSLAAGCPMADMAEMPEVNLAWQFIQSREKDNFLPVCYVNSSAEIKAFCGRHGGVACTSSTAAGAFQWAINQNKKIFFLPDRYLGTNTAHALDIKDSEIAVWDYYQQNGGLKEDDLQKTKVVVWNGFCHVHRIFTPEMVKQMRKLGKNVYIIVHPESTEQVVALADETGSTKQIIEKVKAQPPSSIIVVGTEINLVKRLGHEFKDRKIYPLYDSHCVNMARNRLKDVAKVLEYLPSDNEIIIDPKIRPDAKLALERMLKL